jgi:hypothetical protein
MTDSLTPYTSETVHGPHLPDTKSSPTRTRTWNDGTKNRSVADYTMGERPGLELDRPSRSTGHST